MEGTQVVANPPDSLLKYNAPLFNGIVKDPDQAQGVVENTNKLDDMIHAMLPARYVLFSFEALESIL